MWGVYLVRLTQRGWGTSLVLSGGSVEKLGDNSDSNGLPLVTKHETAHSVEHLVLLHADGVRNLHTHHHSVLPLNELRVLLLDLVRLLVDRCQKLVEGHLLSEGVNVHDGASVPRADDGLHVENHDLFVLRGENFCIV